MRAKTNGGAIKVIASIFILLAVAAALGCVAFFTNGFKDDFKTFYVEVNGEKIISSSGGYVLSKDEPIVVVVKDADSGKKDKGYMVSVIPKEGADFEFFVDDEPMAFAGEKDFTNAFDVSKDGDTVTLKAKGDIKYVLQSNYPDKAIRYDPNSINKEEDIFSLVIKNYDEATVLINFRVPTTVYGITLTPEEIVF